MTTVHVHACIEPEDSDVCASRGECRCECGATMPAMSGDDWEAPDAISDEGAHLVAEYGVGSFDYGQAVLGTGDTGPARRRRELARTVLRSYVASLESQLERQRVEIGELVESFRPQHPKSCTCGDCQWWLVRASEARKGYPSIRAQLERLKAEQLTSHEIVEITSYIPNGLQGWGVDLAFNKYWQTINDKLTALRRLSQSEQPTEELKE